MVATAIRTFVKVYCPNPLCRTVARTDGRAREVLTERDAEGTPSRMIRQKCHGCGGFYIVKV